MTEGPVRLSMGASAARVRLIAALGLYLASAVSAGADTLIVGNKGEDTVSFIALSDGRELARLPTAKAPHEVAVSPDGRQAAVVAYGAASIDIFDQSRARLIRRIDISPNAGPHGIAWIARNQIVAVAERSSALVLIDPRRGTHRSIALGQRGSHMLAVSPDRRRAYVANIMDGTVSVIDLRRREKLGDIAVGGYPEGIAITPDGKQLWVGDNSGPRLRVVDLASRQVIATLPTDSVALRVVITPDGQTAITSGMASGTLNLFDVANRRPVRTIAVSGSRRAMQVTIAFSRDARRLYVAETAPGTIAEVDLASGQVLRRLTAGKNGDGLAVAP